ncbi:hypothetical protein DXJ57_02520 [Vibrio fluvialis]|nr:hypothetical protein [Vibrio fluvialis]
MSLGLTSRLTLGKKMSNETEAVEIRELALALKDLFDIIDGKICIGDVEIKDSRRIRYARTVFEKVKASDQPDFYGI